MFETLCICIFYLSTIKKILLWKEYQIKKIKVIRKIEIS